MLSKISFGMPVLIASMFCLMIPFTRLQAKEYPGSRLPPLHRNIYASNLVNYVEVGRSKLKADIQTMQSKLANFQEAFAKDTSLSKQMSKDLIDLSLQLLILDLQKFNWEFSLAPTADYVKNGTRPSDPQRQQELQKLYAKQAELLKNPLARLLVSPVYQALTTKGRGVYLYQNLPSYFMYQLFAAELMLHFQLSELNKVAPIPFLLVGARQQKSEATNSEANERLAAFFNISKWTKDDQNDPDFKRILANLSKVLAEIEGVQGYEGSSQKEQILAGGKNILRKFFATYAEQLQATSKYLEVKPLQSKNLRPNSTISIGLNQMYSLNQDYFRHYAFMHYFPAAADQEPSSLWNLPYFQISQLRSDLLQFDLEDQGDRLSSTGTQLLYGAGAASIFVPGAGGVLSPLLFGLGALSSSISGFRNSRWAEAQLSLFSAVTDPLHLNGFAGDDSNSAQAQLLNRGGIRQNAKRDFALTTALEGPLLLGGSLRFLKNLSGSNLTTLANAKNASESAQAVGASFLKTVSSSMSVRMSTALLGVFIGWQVWDDYQSQGARAQSGPQVKDPSEALQTKGVLEALLASAQTSAQTHLQPANSSFAQTLRADLQATSTLFRDADLRLRLTLMRDYYQVPNKFDESSWFQLHSGDRTRVIFGKVYYPLARYQKLLQEIPESHQARASRLAGEISEAVLIQSVFQTDAIAAATQLALIQFTQSLLDSNTPVTDSKVKFHRNQLQLFVGEKLAFTTTLALDLPKIKMQAAGLSQHYAGGAQELVPQPSLGSLSENKPGERAQSAMGQQAKLQLEPIPAADELRQELPSGNSAKSTEQGSAKRKRLTPLDQEFWTLNPFSAENPVAPGGIGLFVSSRVGQVYLPNAAVTILQPAYELSAKVLQSPLLGKLSGVAPEFLAHTAWRLGCDQGYLLHKEARENNFNNLSDYLFGEKKLVGLSRLEANLKGIETTQNPLLAHKLNQSITPMALLMFAAGQTIGQRYVGEMVRKGLLKLPYFQRSFGPKLSSVLYDQYGFPLVGERQSYANVIGKISGILVGTELGWSFNDIGWQAANWGKLSLDPIAEVTPYFGSENFGSIDRGWGLLGYTVGGFVGHNMGYSLVEAGLRRFNIQSQWGLRGKVLGTHAGALSLNVALGMTLSTYFPQFAKSLFNKFAQPTLPPIAEESPQQRRTAEEIMQQGIEEIFMHMTQAHSEALVATDAHLEGNRSSSFVAESQPAEAKLLADFALSMRPALHEFVQALTAQMRAQLLEFSAELKSVQSLPQLKAMMRQELHALIPEDFLENKTTTIETLQASFSDPSRIATYKKNFFSLIQELYPTLYRVRFAHVMTQLTRTINFQSDPMLSSLLDLRELVRIQVMHLQAVSPAAAAPIAAKLHRLHADLVHKDLAFYAARPDLLAQYQASLLAVSQKINRLLLKE